jgi:deoxyribonuclease V
MTLRLDERYRHAWHVSVPEARAIQDRLAAAVIRSDALADITNVTGIDAGFINDGKQTRAAVVVLDFPSLEPVDAAIAVVPTAYPYVPGLLSFREIPAVLAALARLRVTPDLILCDGQGIAHPRRCGLASHLGVLTDLPSIGVAKTRFIGQHAEAPSTRGGWSPLLDDEECIGAVLRTRVNVKPLYVSIGHRVSLATAIHYVMACTRRYRLPETTRAAHRLASAK